MKAHRLVLLAVAGTSLLALTGCQSGNVAAEVGDETVTTSDVDFLSRMQCDTLDAAAKDPAQAAQGLQTVATSQVRVGMVNTLVQAELNRQLAARDDLTYDRSTLRNVMDQFETLVKLVPKKDQEHFRDVVEDIYRGQLQVYAAATRDLADQGVESPSQEELDAQVDKIQKDFRKTVDVAINPQYGADADGVAGAVDPSLSVAVSTFAKESRKSQPSSSWVTDLPDDQRCG